jgi:hypothetical protein
MSGTKAQGKCGGERGVVCLEQQRELTELVAAVRDVERGAAPDGG